MCLFVFLTRRKPSCLQCKIFFWVSLNVVSSVVHKSVNILYMVHARVIGCSL